MGDKTKKQEIINEKRTKHTKIDLFNLCKKANITIILQ